MWLNTIQSFLYCALASAARRGVCPPWCHTMDASRHPHRRRKEAGRVNKVAAADLAWAGKLKVKLQAAPLQLSSRAAVAVKQLRRITTVLGLRHVS
ncbi:hypothetical protein VTK73DRAFT_10268 [Phialemonium thermophilum]|uniref:Secreted protein n=1 Tax=Phialemonium thermophilum TaxID=223376 RepID=A0ABR3XGQ2_9PEZI